MTPPELSDAVGQSVVAILRDALDAPTLEVTPDMTPRDVEGWDSIAMMNIVLAVQQRHVVQFRSSEIARLSSVADLVALTRAKSAAPSS